MPGHTLATRGDTFPFPVQYCSEGQHVWFPRCEGDGGMLQCSKCPQVQAAADRPRDPAVHDPQCPGNGLVVMPGFGWSCPTCNRRYIAQRRQGILKEGSAEPSRLSSPA